MLRAALFALVLLGAFVIACSDEAQRDLTPVADSIEAYPGARLLAEGAAPAGVTQPDADDYAYDKLYTIPGGVGVTQEQILDYFKTHLAEQGWQVEDPPGKAQVELFDTYCDGQLIKCVWFTKDDVRAIVSAAAPLSFSPTSGGGSQYHVHLEEYKS